MVALFKNRNAIFLFALVVGFLWPEGSLWTESLTLPALALVMTVATLNVPNDAFKSIRNLLLPALQGIAMSYLVFGGAMVIMAVCFVTDESLRAGLVLVAAAPPAVAVIPFTVILKGRADLSLIGTVGAYLGGLLIMPLAFALLLGRLMADPVKLLWITSILILAPLVLSRIILWFGWHQWILPYRGALTDWGFFIVIYTLFALNRNAIMEMPAELAPVTLIVIVSFFGFGFCIERIGKYLHVEADRIVSLVLLGTLKNQGLAGGLAITLFPKKAALPAAISSIFMILYFIWLDLRARYRERRQKEKL